MSEQQRYRITERLDSGGMAEVFRGVAESLRGFKKNVAIKRILPNLTKHRKFVSMFLDEARLALHLQHANVVQVFDIGVAEGTYFIVMEYVDGANLKTITESVRRQGHVLSVAHVVYLMMEVCKGLAYAHELVDPDTGRPLGIVHRDISPPNILISKMGEVKLVDFGLAKAASQVEDTEPGIVKGKFSYLSPEAASGHEVDHRADIFAVGILLYELLTSRRLFQGETDYQTVELVRQARIPSISAQNPDVDRELEGIIRRALAQRPDDRFQHAADLQDALAHFLFSRGMKVTSSDIRKLVQEALRERARTLPPAPQRSENLIHSLIQEEILQITSLDQFDETAGSGAQPLSPDQISGSGGETIDTREWALEDPSFRIDPGWDATTEPTRPRKALDTTAPRAPIRPSPSSAHMPTPAPIQSLEQLFDGANRAGRAGKPFPTYLLIALVALVALGAGAVFIFRSGIFPH